MNKALNEKNENDAVFAPPHRIGGDGGGSGGGSGSCCDAGGVSIVALQTND